MIRSTAFATLVEEFGRRKAATIVATLGRAIWTAWSRLEDCENNGEPGTRPGVSQLQFRKKTVADLFRGLLRRRMADIEDRADECLELVHAHLAGVDKAWGRAVFRETSRTYAYGNLILRPRQLLASCARGGPGEVNLQYFLRRDISDRGSLADTHEVVRSFTILAETLNGLIEKHAVEPKGGGRRYALLDYDDTLHGVAKLDRKRRPLLMDTLLGTPMPVGVDASSWKNIVNTFIEVCVLVGYLEAGGEPGVVVTRASEVDAEYLLANLFGMPTAIPGFDHLYGGGGLRLRERLRSGESAAGDSTDPASGRILLLRGPRGSGKSCLSLQIACEVANKGGLACVFLMETTPADSLYVMSTFSEGKERNFDVATTLDDAVELVSHSDGDRGGLIFLRGEAGSLEGLFLFLEWMAAHVDQHSLVLMAVDPLTAVYDSAPVDEPELRERTHASLQAIRDAGVNLLMIAEEGAGTLFVENMADTVTQMSVVEVEGYSQRQIEVTKSRYQREQRGTHVFSIKSGTGVHVFPSTASVSARLRGRGGASQRKEMAYGHQHLDEYLLKDSLFAGDVIAFYGDAGGIDFHLALSFLLACNYERDDLQPGSLLISSRDGEDLLMQHISHDRLDAASELVTKKMPSRQHPKAFQNVRVLALPSGFVDPGMILQATQDALRSARAQGLYIDRVVVDGLEHWELTSPMVRKDPVFASTFVNLLCKEGATPLLLCGSRVEESSWQLRRTVIDHADCRVRFDDQPGHKRLQIERSSNLRHRSDAVRIAMDSNWTVALDLPEAGPKKNR